jgi:hypothetical protein
MTAKVIDLAAHKRSGRADYKPLTKKQILQVARKLLEVARHEIAAVQNDEQVAAMSALNSRDRATARIDTTAQVLKTAIRELIRTGDSPHNKT